MASVGSDGSRGVCSRLVGVTTFRRTISSISPADGSGPARDPLGVPMYCWDACAAKDVCRQ